MFSKVILSLNLATIVLGREFFVQLHQDNSFEAFFEKYYNVIDYKAMTEKESSPVKELTIGETFKGVYGEIPMDLMTDMYYDTNVVAISLNRELELAEYLVQSDAPSHLTRLSQKQALSLNTPSEYVYDQHAGIGVDIYIFDTGIQGEHPDFSKRVHKAVDYTEQPIKMGDPHGHGTFVAGIIGSETYGVAKKANLYDVRITEPTGKTQLFNVIKALSYVDQETKVTKRPSLVVLPMSMKKNVIVNSAVEALVAEGVPVIVPAGNDNKSACNFSPGSAKGPLTVGSVDQDDSIAGFSNWGACVDVFAQGIAVQTLANDDFTGRVAKSGTSLSTAAAAGVVACFMSQGDSGTEAVNKVISLSVKDVIPNLSKANTKNRLLQII